MHKHIITMNFHINKYFNLSRVLEQKLFTRKKTPEKKETQRTLNQMLQPEKSNCCTTWVKLG